jgi:hypothetical protein
MGTLQNIGILLGAIGGIITIYKFVQEQGDRRRKRSKDAEDAAFDEWATAHEMFLGGGDGGLLLEVPDDEMRYATRAVREGRLVWSGFPRMIALPLQSAET